MSERPTTRYARAGGLSIAYQVVGDGEVDLVYIPGFVSNVEVSWDHPAIADFYRRLARFSRLVLLDKRGTGLSDPVPVDALPTLEERMDDVRAVLDAIGSEKAALFGVSEGGPMCTLFAATYPSRTRALILFGSYARLLRSEDHPYGLLPEDREAFIELVHAGWGTPIAAELVAPSLAGDDAWHSWWANWLRHSAGPGAAAALLRMNGQVDIRSVLPSVHVPTLVMHRTGDQVMSVDGARAMAAAMPDARFVELPGADHLPWIGDADAVLAEVEELLTGVRSAPDPDRVLATVLFTDIVGSTERAAALGDRRWKELIAAHDQVVRRLLAQHRGHDRDQTGDGFLATFDGPARAIRCAQAIGAALRDLGLEVRSGLHAGEVEVAGDEIRGLAVHIAARVMALAGAGEVLVSQTVRDLVAGSGIGFIDRGVHTLKGVPEPWRVWAVE